MYVIKYLTTEVCNRLLRVLDSHVRHIYNKTFLANHHRKRERERKRREEKEREHMVATEN